MRELFVDSAVAADAQGNHRSYDYSILVDEMDIGHFSCESYGVKILERDTGGVAEAPYITVSADRVDRLIRLLIRNVVTPTTLDDVVQDWL